MESHHCMKHVLEAILPVLNNFWNMALMYVYRPYFLFICNIYAFIFSFSLLYHALMAAICMHSGECRLL